MSDGGNPVTATLSLPLLDAVPPSTPLRLHVGVGDCEATAYWSAPASDGRAPIDRYEYWVHRSGRDSPLKGRTCPEEVLAQGERACARWLQSGEPEGLDGGAGRGRGAAGHGWGTGERQAVRVPGAGGERGRAGHVHVGLGDAVRGAVRGAGTDGDARRPDGGRHRHDGGGVRAGRSRPTPRGCRWWGTSSRARAMAWNGRTPTGAIARRISTAPSSARAARRTTRRATASGIQQPPPGVGGAHDGLALPRAGAVLGRDAGGARRRPRGGQEPSCACARRSPTWRGPGRTGRCRRRWRRR